MYRLAIIVTRKIYRWIWNGPNVIHNSGMIHKVAGRYCLPIDDVKQTSIESITMET